MVETVLWVFSTKSVDLVRGTDTLSVHARGSRLRSVRSNIRQVQLLRPPPPASLLFLLIKENACNYEWN